MAVAEVANPLPELKSRCVSVTSGNMLVLNRVSKRFGRVQALSDITLNIAAGAVHCLLGENGAGKSTLCNLVFGIYQPDAGTMLFDGKPHVPQGPADALRAGIAMVHQHFSLVPDITVTENVLLGRTRGLLDRKSWGERIRALSDEFGLAVNPSAKVGDLSVGERQRVEIIKCMIDNPRLIILDEPTAVLLPEEILKLLGVCRSLAERGCAIVLVTHKLAEIKQIADTVTVLRQGRTVATTSEPAKNIQRLVTAMVQRDLASIDVTLAGTLGVSDDAADAQNGSIEQPLTRGQEVMQLDAMTVRDASGVLRVDEVTLTVDRGEIVGVAGVEGNGQSEIGLVLAGLLKPTSGRVFIGGAEATGRSPREITALGAGIVPEDRHAIACITSMSLAENMLLNRLDRFRRFGLLQRRQLEREAAALMAQFDVRADGPRAPFSSLSGGNQQKAVLARELTTERLLFLLAAQPTRGLDVGAVEAVYTAIREACRTGVGVLLISSELDELIAVAHRIVVLYRGRIIGERRAHPKFRNDIGMLMAGHQS
jgi:general nucleoside transport system ATP-binding protein